ncbi:MAG: hypothetical protein ABIR87_07895 [Sphingomicrobium sp.]
MISFLIGSAISLTVLQAGIDMPRKNFVACLKGAFDTALTQRVATSDYGAFALKTCDNQANNLKSGLVGFDVKNGVRRTQASADAAAQIDDYVAMSTEKYESKVGPSKVNVASNAPPPTSPAVATPAAAPKP